MKLHFKRGKQEGLQPAPFYLTTTATTSPTATHPMCSSPSHSEEPQPSSQDQSLQQYDSPQALEPINPAIQPDPDKEKSNLDHPIDQEEDPEDEADEDQEDPDQEPGVVLSAFPLPPSSIDALADPHVMITSPSASKRMPFSKRKKGKVSVKKRQAIERKRATLKVNLNPVPFMPSKIPDFSRHEKLLKRLGLWDFFHIEFDRNIKADLISELIATYDPKLRCSYVNGLRIAVNRADLARAFKLPVKKEKGGNIDGLEMDSEALTEEAIAFIDVFVSNWVLLHEDTWMMPNEVLNWTKAIKDGHPEKVDWAGLFWFMVEKELLKGEQLVDCYYASHLQYLITSQREELSSWKPGGLTLEVDQDKRDLDGNEVILKGEQDRVDLDAEEEVVKEEEKREVESDAENVTLREEQDEVKFNEEVEEGKGADVKMGDTSEVHGNDALGGPNVELTLGPEVGEKEEEKDAEMMDIEEGEEDEEQDLEQRQWLLDGRNNVGEHFMQRCNVEDVGGFVSFERKEEVDELEEDEEDAEEEGEEGFDVGPSEDTLGGDGLTGNFLQSMETNHIAFGSQGHLHDDSSIDLVDRNELQHISAGGLSFYNDNGKREIHNEHDLLHRSLNGNNKRLRIDGPMDVKLLDFGTCMGQMQQIGVRARMLYEEKEQALEQSNLNQQLLLNELQKRDNMIDLLQKSKLEEMQKRDAEMYRLQRELYLMGNLLDDYKKALKQTHKVFTEYRQKHPHPEEPIYRDAGPGGVVLSTSEIEKLRLKEEEEYKLTCTVLKEKAKEAEEGYALQFGDYLEKVLWLDKKLTNVEKTVKELRESYKKPDISENQQPTMETSECPPTE